MLNIKMLFLLIIFSFTTLLAQQFEGKMKINFKSNKENADMVYYYKGENLRIEFVSDKKLVFIYTDEEMTMMMPDQKMYMKMPKQLMENSMLPAQQYGKKAKKEYEDKIIKTGEYKTILGKKCEKWIIKDGNEESEMWITEDVGDFKSMNNPMQRSNAGGWQSSIEDQGYFPMLVITKNNGKEEGRFEVVELKEMNLENSMFEVPSGFKTMTLPGMNIK